MRTLTIVMLALLAICLSVQSAQAGWSQVLAGPVSRVVATDRHAAALRRQDVLLLRDDGRLVGRVGDGQSTSGRPEVLPFRQAAERTLDRLEIPEIDRDTDYTDDLVDDESRLGERRFWRASRRASPASATPPVPALSATAEEIWIANSQGLYRIGGDGTAVLTFGRQWTGPSIAAAKQRIIVDKGQSLALLSTLGTEPRFIQLSGAVGQLSVSNTGQRIAWTTGTVIHLADRSAAVTIEAPGTITDITFCGETAVALLPSGLLAISPEGHVEIRSAPTEARRMVCPHESGLPWLAVAGGLWLSSDQGQQWSAVPVPAGWTLYDVAVSANHVWLATSEGLFLSTDAVVDTDTGTSVLRTHRNPSPSWLTWIMPKVSLRAAATLAPTGSRLEGFAVAEFPLGMPSKSTPWEGLRASSRSVSAGQGHVPLVAMVSSEDATPVPEPTRPALVLDSPDAQAECLPVARRKAVELVLAEPERARSYVKRAGNAAWLPELRVLLSRRYGRSESLDVSSSSSGLSSPLGIDTVNDIRYEARATWDLGRLVFSSDELAAQTQALHMAELRRDIETTFNRLYFERRRVMVASSADHGVRAKEIEAELDSMSAGVFGSCVSGRSTGSR